MAQKSGETFCAPGVEIKAIASYKGPLLPADEDERMRTVCCAVQNDEDDPVLSSLCKLVCSLLRVPSAAVSIVETRRQYLKSTHGTERACIPRSMSFCQFAFLPRLPVVLVVEDTLEDERFAENPLVKGSANPIRFYAGAPLIASNGKRLGALCLMDAKPRKMTVEDYRVLNSCAEMVVRRLEAQTHTEVAKLETNTMLRSLNAFQQAIMLVDVAARGWEILHANNALLQKLGMTSEAQISKRSVWELFRAAPHSEEQVREGFMEFTSQLKPFSAWLQLKERAPSPKFKINFKPATEGVLDPYTPHINVPEGIPSRDAPAEDLPYYFGIIQAMEAAEGPAQVPAAADREGWRKSFKPLEADSGLTSTPEAPEAAGEAGNGQIRAPAETSAAREVASSAKEPQGPSSGATEGQRGTEKAGEGAQQLPPANSGKLESKERISAMLQQTSAFDSAAQQPAGANGKTGQKIGCFGGQRDSKESSKPCVIF